MRLYGNLRRFGREFRLDVATTGEAIKALVTQVPGLRQAMQPGWFRVRYGKGKYLHQHDLRRGVLSPLPSDETVHIVPVAGGAKSGWGIFGAVLGVGLIAAAFFTGGTSLSAWGALEWGLAAGGGLLLGVAAMLTRTPTTPTATNDGATERRNTTFSGIDNMTPQGRPVPLCYGEMVVGSLVVSQGLYSE